MPRVSTEARNAAVAAVGTLCNGGVLRVYADPYPSVIGGSGGTLLAEVELGSPAFGSPLNGTIQATPTTADPDVNATGAAAWFRILKSDWSTTVLEGVVGEELTLSNEDLQAGGEFSIESLTISQP